MEAGSWILMNLCMEFSTAHEKLSLIWHFSWKCHQSLTSAGFRYAKPGHVYAWGEYENSDKPIKYVHNCQFKWDKLRNSCGNVVNAYKANFYTEKVLPMTCVSLSSNVFLGKFFENWVGLQILRWRNSRSPW